MNESKALCMQLNENNKKKCNSQSLTSYYSVFFINPKELCTHTVHNITNGCNHVAFTESFTKTNGFLIKF